MGHCGTSAWLRCQLLSLLAVPCLANALGIPFPFESARPDALASDGALDGSGTDAAAAGGAKGTGTPRDDVVWIVVCLPVLITSPSRSYGPLGTLLKGRRYGDGVLAVLHCTLKSTRRGLMVEDRISVPGTTSLDVGAIGNSK